MVADVLGELVRGEGRVKAGSHVSVPLHRSLHKKAPRRLMAARWEMRIEGLVDSGRYKFDLRNASLCAVVEYYNIHFVY